MSQVVERVVTFDCEGETLLGIVSEPADGALMGKPAVLIVVGGPQYRAGAHRMFVQLARELARAGHLAMRFDVRGMGDASGAQRDFESLTPDIAAAVGKLRAETATAAQITLFGLCDGASAAMLYVDEHDDPGVTGICAANPWVRSEAGQARTHLRHYYLQRLASREFWRKALRGGLGVGAVREFLGKTATSLRSSGTPAGDAKLSYMERMARGCQTLGADRIAVALSADDLTAREFETYAESSARWKSVLQKQRNMVWRFEATDHTFSQSQGAARLATAIVGWLGLLTSMATLTHDAR